MWTKQTLYDLWDKFDLWVCCVTVSGISTLQLFGCFSASHSLSLHLWIPAASAVCLVLTSHHAALPTAANSLGKYPLLWTKLPKNIFQHFESTGYCSLVTHFFSFSFFFNLTAYADLISIPLPCMKTENTQWNVTVAGRVKDWLVFESSTSFSFKCKEA